MLGQAFEQNNNKKKQFKDAHILVEHIIINN